eukprot:899789-Rhodomonas_salina.6
MMILQHTQVSPGMRRIAGLLAVRFPCGTRSERQSFDAGGVSQVRRESQARRPRLQALRPTSRIHHAPICSICHKGIVSRLLVFCAILSRVFAILFEFSKCSAGAEERASSSARRNRSVNATIGSDPVRHYLGEDEDNLLWELRKNDPGLVCF